MHRNRRERIEQTALRLSLAGTLVAAAAGFYFGIHLGSNAILLDGIFSLLSMGMTGLNIYVAALLTRPDDERFHYGYGHLEPMVNVVNGLFILSVCCFAFYQGVTVIFAGGHQVEMSSALYYTSAMTLFCFSLYGIERYLAQRCHSSILRVDMQEWLVDGLLSLGILCGFLLGAFLERQGYDQWTPYIDPALTSLISLFAVMLPIRVLRANISEVLLRAPEDSYQQRVDELVTEIEANYPIQESEWYLAKTGRRYDLEINFLVAQGTFETMKEQDELRNYIWNRLKQRGVEVWLTVSFTAQEKWL